MKPLIAEITKYEAAQILETPISSVDYAAFGATNFNESIKNQKHGGYVKSKQVYIETTEDGEIILYHIDTRKYYYMNTTLAVFWQHCKSYSSETISGLLADQGYNDAISYLVKRGLLSAELVTANT